ncbi:UNVERIFIED_CONTAM: hypothetical protein GTU68_014737 [Idotea baltica]|nr:hypothetical protein [Idotea baltica]
MTNRKFADLFGQPRREPEHGLLTQFHMDVAASIQAVTEEVVLAMCRSLAEEYDCHNLCMAGGVALNCVANGKILADNAFKNVWVQPAAGDAGGALGAAYAAWHTEMGNARSVKKPDAMQGSYLGPAYSDKEISTQLQNCGAVFEKIPTKDVIEKTVCDLADGKAVGWFQGKMEFGARALGGRSIIADSRSLTMQKKLNLKVKFRESFRPFAPSVLREDLHHWFELETDSPYMLFVASIKENLRIEMTADESELFGIDKLNVPRSPIPAVTHVDYSARIQTVHKETNPRYHELIDSFKKFTGCPILVNTSFNVRGEPIVCTPTDAFRCFMGTELDVLVIENFYLVKSSQTVKPIGDYHDKYDLD